MTDAPPTRLTIHQPDDCHAHFRDGAVMRFVVPKHGWANRVVVMPNLHPDPIRTTREAIDYQCRLFSVEPQFKPMMTLYMTDGTEAKDIEFMAEEPDTFAGVKLYPQGATVNSDKGVTDISKVYDIIELMQKLDVPLLVHGEVGDQHIDIYDREQRFIDYTLIPLLKEFRALRVVLEHISTAAAVHVVENFANCHATVTPQHLLVNRTTGLFAGNKVHPHAFCLPILKRETDRQTIISAVMHGKNRHKYFAGTDSAPHVVGTKHCAEGCAGCFTAPHAVELYAQAFHDNQALDSLDDFMSRNGAAFYRWDPSTKKVTLQQSQWDGRPEAYFAKAAVEIVPWYYGPLDWQTEVDMSL